jgi:hypothetical protein
MLYATTRIVLVAAEATDGMPAAGRNAKRPEKTPLVIIFTSVATNLAESGLFIEIPRD